MSNCHGDFGTMSCGLFRYGHKSCLLLFACGCSCYVVSEQVMWNDVCLSCAGQALSAWRQWKCNKTPSACWSASHRHLYQTAPHWIHNVNVLCFVRCILRVLFWIYRRQFDRIMLLI